VVNQEEAVEFLRSGRIAVVGASDDAKNFGGTVLRALADHGVDAVPVNPGHDEVGGRSCYATIADVPGDVDGVIVMVSGADAVQVVGQSIARKVPRVWLFKGIGGPGALSDEAVALCEDHDTAVIAGACPLMFLEPVKGAHRFHRTLRRLNGSVEMA
jgi:predicted CoA-binding protein